MDNTSSLLLLPLLPGSHQIGGAFFFHRNTFDQDDVVIMNSQDNHIASRNGHSKGTQRHQQEHRERFKCVYTNHRVFGGAFLLASSSSALIIWRDREWQLSKYFLPLSPSTPHTWIVAESSPGSRSPKRAQLAIIKTVFIVHVKAAVQIDDVFIKHP